MKEKFRTIKPDRWIMYTVIVLVILGVMFVIDTCAVTRISDNNFKYMRAVKQLFFAIIGYVLCCFITQLDLRALRKMTFVSSVIILFALVVVLIIGGEVKGASRWLSMGFLAVQPSEFAKLAVILCMAWVVNESRAFQYRIWEDHKYMSKRGIWLTLVGLCIFILLLVSAENMSGGIILGVTAISMLFFGGLSTGYFLGLISIGTIGGVIFLFAGKSFRMARIEAFKNPLEYMNDIGAQVVHSLISISSGGLFGKGFGNGTGKSIIPEPDNDYIFPTIIEEWGFIGGLLFIVLYITIAWRGMIIIRNCKNLYGRMLVMGALVTLTFQMFVNMAVCLHIIPVTGVCLPFVSYGGSSMMVSFIMIGIILSVSRQIKMPNHMLIYPVSKIDYEKSIKQPLKYGNRKRR